MTSQVYFQKFRKLLLPKSKKSQQQQQYQQQQNQQQNQQQQQQQQSSESIDSDVVRESSTRCVFLSSNKSSVLIVCFFSLLFYSSKPHSKASAIGAIEVLFGNARQQLQLKIVLRRDSITTVDYSSGGSDVVQSTPLTETIELTNLLLQRIYKQFDAVNFDVEDKVFIFWCFFSIFDFF